MGHTSDPEELKMMTSFIESVFQGKVMLGCRLSVYPLLTTDASYPEPNPPAHTRTPVHIRSPSDPSFVRKPSQP